MVRCLKCNTQTWTLPPDDSAPICNMCGGPLPLTSNAVWVNPCRQCGRAERYDPILRTVGCPDCKTTRQLPPLETPKTPPAQSQEQDAHTGGTKTVLLDVDRIVAGHNLGRPSVLAVRADGSGSSDRIPGQEDYFWSTLPLKGTPEAELTAQGAAYLARHRGRLLDEEGGYGMQVRTVALGHDACYIKSRLPTG